MLVKCLLLFLTIYVINAQILPPTGFRRVRPGPIINTNAGPIQGQEETYDLFRRIYTFKGIRYAQAPVGDLRFRAPVPAQPTVLVHQAWENGPSCPQYSLLLNRYQGEEDCLFLNIATPTNIRSRLPVVVSIHGGGLQYGSGTLDELGPEYLNQEGVIFVSMNYRLNVLGFLNVGDANSPGNYGLKDIIESLRWVQDNIEFFGGDKDDVTIWGISGGGVAVHSLVISQAAAGLFHKAISHSGSLFSTWAYNRNPLNSVQMLIRNLQIAATNTTDLMRQLRLVSAERLLEAAEVSLRDLTPPVLFNELNFMPSQDPFDSTEPRIFILPPAVMVISGLHNQVPYMVGFNSLESMNSIRDLYDPLIRERFNQNPNLLIPPEWNIAPNSPEAVEVITSFRNLYFNGAVNLTVDNFMGWINYASDRDFIFGCSKQARLHRSQQPVFYFRFSYSGSLSFAQRLAGLSSITGAMHGDDMFHIFRLNVLVTPVLPSDEAFVIQRRQVRLWSNFIKFGDPTPTTLDPLIEATWDEMTAFDDFMDIGQSLRPDVGPFAQRMNTWHAFDARFNP